ncbi:MAG TPA: hypothetical protein VMR19_03715 [Candidatus Saccharimonadales bacterium]|jgi:CHASE3 domain sensor protein|nr:hypothetical protein [Candidatus Saccharimonadales bacterium]
MISQNFLYYSLGIGFLILVGFSSYAFFSLSKSLKKLTSILIKVDDVVKDADDLKNYVKQGILYLMSVFVKKGGDKHGK